MKSACWALCVALMLIGGAPGTCAAPLRVALMEFSVDDNSYRSAAAVSDFTAALQARLTGESPVEWIERQQLATAEREIELSLMGAASGLQRGQWLKADMMVTGAFITNKTGRALHLEVVDVDRADVLAAKEVQIAVPPKPPLSGLISQLDRVAAEVAQVVSTAIEKKQQTAGRRSLAVLFLNNSPFNRGWDDLERMLGTSLEEQSAKRGDFRVLRFKRANRARDEASLVMGGLVNDATNAFHNVADVYVWGSVDRVAARGRFQQQVKLSVWNGSSVPVELVRATTNSPIEFANELSSAVIASLTNAASAAGPEEIRARLSRELWQNAYAVTERDPSAYAGNVEGRTRLFKLLKLFETACFLDPANREAQADRILYRWGNPPYPMARERDLWAYWRYSDAWDAHVNRFGFELRKTNAAGVVKVQDIADYYFRSTWFLAELVRDGNRTEHGFPVDVPTRVANQWGEDFHKELVRRAIKVADRKSLAQWVCQTISAVLEEPGAPVALRDRTAQKQLVAAVWPHLVRHYADGAHVQFASFVRPAINKLYAGEGKPSEGDRLFALLKAPQQQPAAPVVQTPRPPAGQASAGQASAGQASPSRALESTQEELLMALPDWDLAIPVLTGTVERVAFPKEIVVQKVTSLTFGSGKVWIVSDGMRQVAVEGSNELEREFGSVKGETAEFWSYDPSDRTMKSLRHLLPTNSTVLNVKAGGTNVWLGATDGLYRLTRDSAVERVGETNVGPVYGIAIGPERLLAAKNTRQGGTLTLASGAWTNYTLPIRLASGGHPVRVACWDTKALLAVQEVTLLDLASGAATFVTNLVDGASRRIDGAAVESDKTGFWIGGNSGLHFVDEAGRAISRWLPARVSIANPLHPDARNAAPTTPNLPSQFGEWRRLRETVAASRRRGETVGPLQPRTRLMGPVTALASEGEFLWMMSAGKSEFWLLLFHKQSGKWVGRMKLPLYRVLGAPAIALSEDSVWLGLLQSVYQGELAPLLRIPKQTFHNVPREKWVSDEVTSEELAQVEGWKNSEQAIYHLFNGDPDRAVQSLGKVNQNDMDLESLYAMGCAHDDLGLDQPEKARPYFSEIVSREGDSPWGAEARRALAALDFRVAEAKRQRELLTRYDKNRDGRIDDAEGEQMRSDPQFIQEEKERIAARKEKADRDAEEKARIFIGSHDLDRNGRLGRMEFMTGRNASGAVTGPLFDPFLFDMHDTNRNGELDTLEVSKLLESAANPSQRPMRPGPVRPPIR